jgi:hypothetical protein
MVIGFYNLYVNITLNCYGCDENELSFNLYETTYIGWLCTI